MDPEYTQQHAIPSEISSYQFKLVGDMTLAQFFQVAGGALISILIYSSGLNPLLKWPLIIGSFVFGVALAFVPLQDRPLQKWIILFFRAIYAPTQFRWRKAEEKPQYFKPEEEFAHAQAPMPASTGEESKPEPITPQQHEAKKAQNELEVKEAQFLNMISTHLDPTGASNPAPIPQPAEDNAATVDVQVPEEPVQIADSSQNEGESSDGTNLTQQVVPNHTLPKNEELNQTQPLQPQQDQTPTIQNATTPEQIIQSINNPQTTSHFDYTPKNMISGVIHDVSGKPLENAILELRDQENRPARAFKTNRSGEFRIATPLKDGSYTMTIEKDGHHFEPVVFEAKGEVIPEFNIQAQEIPHMESNDNQSQSNQIYP